MPTISQQVHSKARFLCRKLGKHHSEIPDLEQELSLGLWKSLDRFQASKQTLEAFVKMVLHRRGVSVIRKYRARKRNTQSFSDLEKGRYSDISTSDPICRTILILDFRSMAEKIHGLDRKVLQHIGEMSHREIAKLLQVSLRQVKESILRLRQRLENL